MKIILIKKLNPKPFTLNPEKGFTLIEVLTIAGITAIIGSIGALILPGFRAQNSLDLAIRELRADLRDAQQRSISQDQSQQYGVHLDASAGGDDFYKVFSGSSYAGGTVSKTLYLPPILQFLSPAQGATDDIIFDKVTGNVPISHGIVIALADNNSITRSITIPTSGLITYSLVTPSFDLFLSINPPSGSVLRGNAISATVDASLLSGISSQSNFSISNLPENTSADFSPISCNPTCSSLMTIITTGATPSGVSVLTVKVISGSLEKTVNYTLTVVGQTVPDSPTNSSATAGNSQIALNWQASISDGGDSITNYKIYRGTSSGGETLLTTIGNFLNYTDNVTAGTTYYYKVSAINIVGESALSSEVFGKSAVKVFVTSTAYNGNLGGLSGADSKCQDRANAASLGGTWKAWLSSGSVSATSRLTHLNIPYVLVDNLVVANNWNDLIDGSLMRPIYKSESNTFIYRNVWTDTNTSGNIYNGGITCSNWGSASAGVYSFVGNSGYANSSWTIYFPNPFNPQPSACNNQYSLYCIQQ